MSGIPKSLWDAQRRAESAWKGARDDDDGVDEAFSRIDHAAGLTPKDLDALAAALAAGAARVKAAASRLRADIAALEHR